jgi:hypothetical protein
MATLDNIERVRLLDPEVLDRRYIRSGTPVILTGLYDGAPVSLLSDPAVARARLADMPLPVRANPVSELLQDREPPVQTVRFADFFDRLGAGEF